MPDVGTPSNDFSRITLDPNGQILGAGPTFVVEADLSQPVTLPAGVEYVGPAPVFGVDYGPGIGGTPATPTPTEAPPGSPPAVIEPTPPPLEGEVIPGPGGSPTTIFEDYGDVPFDPEAGEVLFMPTAATLRQMPSHTLRVRLVAVDETGERSLGDYTFRHSAD